MDWFVIRPPTRAAERLARRLAPAGLLAVALAAILAGCSRSATPQNPAPPPAQTPVPALATLVIPVTKPERARVVLSELAARAHSNGELAWARVHYLIDLFDDARFRRDDHSLALLHQALGHENPAARGAAATDRVLGELLREVDSILAGDRLHEAALAARTVLEFDSRPPATRIGLFARMAELKAIARGGGPLSANASLRLLGYCLRALGDAPRAKYAKRTRVIAHCLYPLYDSDPEPYFAGDPERRPPPPRWRDLVAAAATLAGQVANPAAGRAGRLAAAGAHAAAALAAIEAEDGAALPELGDPVALGLPRADGAVPYDWTPLLRLGRGEDLSALDDLPAVTRLLQGDGRQVLTVALAKDAPAERLAKVARAARSAGAHRLQLAVVSAQQLKIPPGDYWHGRVPNTPENKLERWAVIELSLAALEGPAGARTPDWDPQRATLGLVLEVSAAAWRLASPEGDLALLSGQEPSRAAAGAAVDTAAGAASGIDNAARARALSAALARVSSAFPDEDGLLVAAGAGASVADLVAAVRAVQRGSRGRPLMGQVGLRIAAPPPAQGALAERIARRAGARVAIVPAALAVRAPAVRSCYQTLLESEPGLRATLRLELQKNRVVVTRGPKNKALRACVLTSLAEAMKAESMASAAVELTPQ